MGDDLPRRRFLARVGSGGVALAGGGVERLDRGFSRRTEREPDSRSDLAADWRELAPLPTARSGAGGGVLNGELYCFGGFEAGPGLAARPEAFAYDPAGERGSWKRVRDMPRALWAPCGVATDRRLFSFGGAPAESPYRTGDPPSDEIFAYEPGEGWRNLTETRGVRCPYPNWAMGGAYDPDDGIIYCVGGGTDVTDRDSASAHGVENDNPARFDESRLWTFDPERERVVDPDLARMPDAKRWPSVALVEVDGTRYVHAICGVRGLAGATASNYRYDVDAGTWSEASPAPRAGAYATTDDPVVRGDVYLTHGLFWADEPSVDSYATACHRYDPETDSFDEGLPGPAYPRSSAVDGVIGETVYVVGGHVKRYDRDGFHECVRDSEAFGPVEGIRE